MKKRWIISTIAIIALLGGVVGVLLANREPAASEEPTPAALIVENPAVLLNVPLADSIDDRNSFMEIYRGLKSKLHARALYEEYLPKIGANGLIDSIETVTPLCHDEGHDLGKVIYAELEDVGSSLFTCHDACASGCMHGVLMEFFGTSYDTGEGEDRSDHVLPSDIQAKIPTLCDTEALTDMYLPGDCAHGVGHAIMFLTDYDLEEAIKSCELFETYPMQYYCATGAYMEYVSVKKTEDAKTKPVFYPCDVSPYPAACFRYKLTDVFARQYLAKEPFEEIRDLCLALPENARVGCFHGVGNAHMGWIARGETTVARICNVGTDDDITACIEGAMERLGKFYPEVAVERCEPLTLDWHKEICVAAATRKMYDLEKSFDLYQK